MAGQDFANLKETRPEDVRPMGQTKVLMLIIVALAVVAAGFSVGLMMGQEMGKQKAISEEKARLVEQLKSQQEELSKLRAAAKQRLPEVSTTEVGELTFYNELPQQSVDPEPLTSDLTPTRKETNNRKDKTMPSEQLLKSLIEHELSQAGQKRVESGPVSKESLAGHETYYLQLASFQKQSDAEAFFPKLDKTGFKGVIKRVELPKLGVWYRVYAGPFSTRLATEEAKRGIKEKLKISGLVVKGD